MGWFRNLKISIKLLVGFLAVAVIAGIIGVVGVINIMNIDKASTQLYEDNTLGLRHVGDASIQFQRIRVNALKLLLVTDEKERSEYIDKINEHVNVVESELKRYEEVITNEDDQKRFSTVMNLWANFQSLLEDIIQHIESGENEEAQKLMFEKSGSTIDSLNDMFEELFEYNTSEAEEKANRNTRVSNMAANTMMLVVMIGTVIAVLLGLFISRIISKPIIKLEETAQKIALGDVNVKIETNTKDEIGKLMLAFSEMVDNIREQVYVVEKMASGDMTVQVKIKSENDIMGKKLTEMININNEVLGSISSAANEVASGAKQVANSSQILSHGATEQASSIEEVTESMSQIAEQTRNNAQNAAQANELGLNARQRQWPATVL